MKVWKWMATGMLLALGLLPQQGAAQEGVGDVVYVPTPQIVVDEMLRMAKVGPADFVIDLGSGDGRMVITAAKKFGARGFGVDLDTVLLKISNEAAQREGVADRARFIEQNLFETDLSQATVITSYLLPEMNEKLRPKILSMKPGTRVVAHDYHMGEWRPDENKTLSVPEKTVGIREAAIFSCGRCRQKSQAAGRRRCKAVRLRTGSSNSSSVSRCSKARPQAAVRRPSCGCRSSKATRSVFRR